MPRATHGFQVGHGVAIASALTAFDADQHARAVDVTDLERRHLGDPQARAIGHGQGGTVLEAFGRPQQPRDFVGTQHRRQLAGIAQADELAGQIRPVERVREEERSATTVRFIAGVSIPSSDW